MTVAQAAVPRVLVIDDEGLFCAMLRDVLKGEFEVLAAHTVEEGIKLFEREHPDAVLLDLVMPDRDGLQGLRAIRSLDPATAVAILTGFGKLETAKRAMELGANLYLEKPIEPEELRRAVRTCVQRTQSERRRANTLAEMTAMIRGLTEDLERRSARLTEAEVAVELIFDLAPALSAAVVSLERVNRRIAQEKPSDGGALAQVGDWLRVAEFSVERCRELIQMGQDLANWGNEDSAFAVGEVMNEVVAEMAEWALAAGLRLDAKIYPGLAELQGRRPTFARAVKSVVGRAIQASWARHGVIRVACVQGSSGVEIRVEDHGAGYDLETAPQRWQGRVDRRDLARAAEMGLCLAARVVEAHGGRLHAESAIGKGSVVFLRFPLPRPAAAD